MKFHVATTDGGWVGGFYCRYRRDVAGMLRDLQPVAATYPLPLVVTRVDRLACHAVGDERYEVTPSAVTRIAGVARG